MNGIVNCPDCHKNVVAGQIDLHKRAGDCGWVYYRLGIWLLVY